jgi:hypothetical protein
MRYPPPARSLLWLISLVLLVILAGCDYGELGFLESVLTYPNLREIRYYRYTSPPDACTPIRFILPTFGDYEGYWEDRASEALEAFATKGIRVVTPTGVYRVRYVT